MSLRTPLGKVRGLGAARDGTGHWWAQRVTAIALVPLVIWFMVAMIGLLGADYDTVRAWLGRPLVSVLLLLLLGAVFYHARLGLNVVIEDYVHGKARHLAPLIATTPVARSGCAGAGAGRARGTPAGPWRAR